MNPRISVGRRDTTRIWTVLSVAGLLAVACDSPSTPQVPAASMDAVDLGTLAYTRKDDIASLNAVTDSAGNLWVAWTDGVDRGNLAAEQHLYAAVTHGLPGSAGFRPGIPVLISNGSFGAPTLVAMSRGVLLYCSDMFGPYMRVFPTPQSLGSGGSLQGVRFPSGSRNAWAGYWEDMIVKRRAGRSVLVCTQQAGDDSAIVAACALGDDDSTIVRYDVIARFSRWQDPRLPAALAATRDGFRWFARETGGPTTRMVRRDSLVLRPVPGMPDTVEILPAKFEPRPGRRFTRLLTGVLDGSGRPTGAVESIDVSSDGNSIPRYDCEDIVGVDPDGTTCLLFGDQVQIGGLGAGRWILGTSLGRGVASGWRAQSRADALDLPDGRMVMAWVGAHEGSDASDSQAMWTGASEFFGMGDLDFVIACHGGALAVDASRVRRMNDDVSGVRRLTLCPSERGPLVVFVARAWPKSGHDAGPWRLEVARVPTSL